MKIFPNFFEGKKTFVLLKALSKAKYDDKKFFQKILNKEIETGDFDKYKNLCIKLGVLKDVGHEVDKYLKLAKDSIKSIPENEGKILLNLLLDRIGGRKK